MLFRSGRPLLVDRHLDRLRKGAIILDIPFQYHNEAVYAVIEELIRKNKLNDGILNVYLTPGDRQDDPAKMSITDPFFLMLLRPWPHYNPSDQVTLDVRQESFQKTQLDRFKTLSWMKNVLEKNLASTDHVLLYNSSHHVLEAANANVFFVKGDVLVTPKSSLVLPGITRQFLIDFQDEMDLKVLEEEVFLDQLHSFDELFLTNALRGIILVEETVGYSHLCSKSVSKRVQKAYLNHVLTQQVEQV